MDKNLDMLVVDTLKAYLASGGDDQVEYKSGL